MSKKLVFALAITAMAVGFVVSNVMQEQPVVIEQPAFQGNLVVPPRKIALPELSKHDGNALSNEDVQGHWSMVFFGYTNCPDICPMTLNVLAEARKQAAADFPRVFFVSVDPARDSIEQLGEYVQYFDKTFTGVGGSLEMLKALTLQMSAVFMHTPAEPGNEGNYLVDHSASVMLLNPEGKLHAFLRAPHTPSSINNSLKEITGF